MDTKTLLNDIPERLIERYRAALQAAGVPVEQVILFGSYAKKTSKPWSDLDLCIVSKVFGKNMLKERMKLASLTIDIDTMIEPHPYHPKDLADKYDPLATEIRRYGIRVA